MYLKDNLKLQYEQSTTIKTSNVGKCVKGDSYACIKAKEGKR